MIGEVVSVLSETLAVLPAMADLVAYPTIWVRTTPRAVRMAQRAVVWATLALLLLLVARNSTHFVKLDRTFPTHSYRSFPVIDSAESASQPGCVGFGNFQCRAQHNILSIPRRITHWHTIHPMAMSSSE